MTSRVFCMYDIIWHDDSRTYRGANGEDLVLDILCDLLDSGQPAGRAATNALEGELFLQRRQLHFVYFFIIINEHIHGRFKSAA